MEERKLLMSKGLMWTEYLCVLKPGVLCVCPVLVSQGDLRGCSLCCSTQDFGAVLTLETMWQAPVSYCRAAGLILPFPQSSLQDSTQLSSTLASVLHNYWVFISIYPSAETVRLALGLLLSLCEETGAPGWVQLSNWWWGIWAPVWPDNLRGA